MEGMAGHDSRLVQDVRQLATLLDSFERGQVAGPEFERQAQEILAWLFHDHILPGLHPSQAQAHTDGHRHILAGLPVAA